MIAASRPAQIEHKSSGTHLASHVVTEIDRNSERILVDALTPSREHFGLGLLTEERPDDASRFSSDYFWSIDPLDGTLPFIEGRPGYAVSIALVRRDGSPQVGVVYDPTEHTLLHAVAGVGIYRNGAAWAPDPAEPGSKLTVLADRSFLANGDNDRVIPDLKQVAIDLGCDGVHLCTGAGAVMNACGVLASPPACYIKLPSRASGASLWDFAATACLFGEAGAIATDWDGARLDLNRVESTRINDNGVLFASDAELASHLRSRI